MKKGMRFGLVAASLALVACGTNAAEDTTAEDGALRAQSTLTADGVETKLADAAGRPLATMRWSNKSHIADVSLVAPHAGSSRGEIARLTPEGANDLVKRLYAVALEQRGPETPRGAYATCSGDSEGSFELNGCGCTAWVHINEDCTTSTTFQCNCHSE